MEPFMKLIMCAGVEKIERSWRLLVHILEPIKLLVSSFTHSNSDSPLWSSAWHAPANFRIRNERRVSVSRSTLSRRCHHRFHRELLAAETVRSQMTRASVLKRAAVHSVHSARTCSVYDSCSQYYCQFITGSLSKTTQLQRQLDTVRGTNFWQE